MGHGTANSSQPEPAATVPLRPCLGLLSVVALALAMVPRRDDEKTGVYMLLTVAAAIAATALAVVACSLPRWVCRPPVGLGRVAIIAAVLFLTHPLAHRAFTPEEEALTWVTKIETPTWVTKIVVVAALGVGVWVALRRRELPFPTALVAALALVLSGVAVFAYKAFPSDDDPATTRVLWSSLAGFGLTVSLLIHGGTATRWRGRLLTLQVVLLFVAGAVLRYAAVRTWSDPTIDLYIAQQQAAGHLLAGENPYTAKYKDEGAPFYPPLPLLAAAVVRPVAEDVRMGYVACDLIAALALFAAARSRLGAPGAAFLTSAYLNFPRVPLIMVLAWNEPLLAALLGAGLILAGRGWRIGHFLIGLGVTGKQYGIVWLPALVKSFQGRRVALLLGVGLAGVVVVLPFFLWERHAFVDRVVDYHLKQEVRYAGVTLAALAHNEYGMTIPPRLLLALTILLIGWIAWRTPSTGPGPAPWLAASLMVFCLFHSQAFINYFYLCQYLMLFGLADWFARDLEGTSPESAK